MHYLSQEQISSISGKLKEAEINYSHLFDDLLDHVCCDIELLMQDGLDYTQASKKIFKKIGLNGLRKIQEATIFYVKLNLIVMKKLMNVLAIIGTTILTFGFIFKSMHLPGGSILFTLGSLILFLGFFPTALLSIRKELKLSVFSKQFGVYVIGFISLLSTGAALLFTTMHWPGTRYLIILSWILMMLVFFPILFFQIRKSEKNKVINLAIVIFAFAFFGFLIVGGYNQNTNIYKLVEVYDDNTDITFYKTSVAKLQQENPADNAKLLLLNKSMMEIEAIIESYKNMYLNDKEDIYNATIDFLHYGKLNPEHEGGLMQLRTALSAYEDLAIELSPDNEILQNFIYDKLTTDDKNYDHLGPTSWEKRHLWYRNQKEALYISLNKLLKDACHVHYEVLRNYSIHKAPEL